MTTPLPALRDFSDRLSPMVVKEMRQGLRTRFFTAALILFHVVLGCLMMAYVSSLDHRQIHEMFWTIISVTLLAVLPSRGFDALHAEIKDGTLDTLLLTGMPSFRIVWGKWVSLFSQTLLVTGSLLPYMIVRYQFGGVEIVRELISLAALVVGSGLATASLVGLSSQSLKLVRLLAAALTGIGVFAIGIFAYFTACNQSAGQEVVRALTAYGLPAAIAILLWLLLLAVYLGYVFLGVGSARLPGLPDSHALVKRKAAFVMMIVLGAVSWWIHLARPGGLSGYNAQNVIVWASFLPSLLLVMLLGMDLCTEEVPPASPGRFSFLSRPGWPSGVFIILGLSVSPMLSHEALLSTTTRSSSLMSWHFTTSFLIACLLPLCLPTGPWLARISPLSRWWLVQMVLGILGFLLVATAEAARSSDRIFFGYLGLVTPVTSLFTTIGVRTADRESISMLGIVANSVWMLIAVLFACGRLNRHRRECALLNDHEPYA
ncbi:ABC transporter permease [Brevifollis gellanilyticus]|uniref:Uncharacterized protein n=1 Tax=Brevifollis gellanilyticus TaxID=748831 RepID=A0A512M8Z1_9BACT|nr:hypothetical protein [Brevifollis gellanilyticus]GEP43199.1 hypothetical protein BGE01nite_24900 [Brevifollis gellanilyticus]